jgi:hypothetical protein
MSEQFRTLALHNEVLRQEYGILGRKTVYFGENSTFRWNISPPSSGWKCKPSEKQAEADGKLSSCFAYFSTLKMESICASETLSSFRNTRLFNPDSHTLHRYRWENLKSKEVIHDWNSLTSVMILLSIYISMVVQPFVGSCPLFQFLNPIDNW